MRSGVFRILNSLICELIHSFLQQIFIKRLLYGDTKLDTMDLGINKKEKILVLFSEFILEGIENKHTQRQYNFQW